MCIITDSPYRRIVALAGRAPFLSGYQRGNERGSILSYHRPIPGDDGANGITGGTRMLAELRLDGALWRRTCAAGSYPVELDCSTIFSHASMVISSTRVSHSLLPSTL